jgi:hypothetical protein
MENILPPGLAGFVQGRNQAAQDGQLGMNRMAQFAQLQGLLQKQQEEQAIKGILSRPGPIESKLQELAALGPTGITVGQGLLQQNKLATETKQAQEKSQFFSPQGLSQFMKPEYAAVPPVSEEVGGMGPSREQGPLKMDFPRMLETAASRGFIPPETYANHLAQRKQAEAQLAATQQNRTDMLTQREMELAARMEDRALSREQQAALAREQMLARREAAQARIDASAAARATAGRPVLTDIADPLNPNNTLRVDATKFNEERYRAGDRTGVIGTGPKLTQTGTAAFKQATQMEGFASDIQKAEDLLSGIKRDPTTGAAMEGSKPTGSGIGRAVDVVGDVFGYSVPGAAESADLKAVAARLTMRVPRFEGPQSDKDREEYKAGQLANDKVARETRLSAIRKMREIYTGYEDGTRGRLVQQQVQNTARRIANDADYNALPSGAEFIAPDGSRRRKP